MMARNPSSAPRLSTVSKMTAQWREECGGQSGLLMMSQLHSVLARSKQNHGGSRAGTPVSCITLDLNYYVSLASAESWRVLDPCPYRI